MTVKMPYRGRDALPKLKKRTALPIIWTFSVLIMIFGTGLASSQGFPNKPIRIVTGGVGGATDFTARLIAQGVTGPLGQPVIVDNRAGSVVILAEIVSKAWPDGYALLLFGNALWLLPFMQGNVPWDPVRDFSPITTAVSGPSVLVVFPSLPVKSVAELMALAKAKPGELNYASGGAGTLSHLATELFKAMAGVNIVRVPYKSGGQAVNEVLAGQVQLMFAPSMVMPHVKSGRLRALAVTSLQPSGLVPGLPTISASGLPGYEAKTTYGIFAPAKTPVAIINRLNQEIVRVLNRTDVKETFVNTGVETVGSSPEELTATMKSEMARMGKVIKDVGIRAE